jgi:hypothetical protein
MAPRQYATSGIRLPQAQNPNLKRLSDRIERRRPKPKNSLPPENYHNLVETLDKTTAIPQNYSDASKDNIRGLRGKFIRYESWPKLVEGGPGPNI